VSDRHLRLTPEVARPLLRGRLGEPYLWSEACTSTQDVLDEPGLPEGAVAVTEHQTAGRGRSGRPWEDEPGASLLVSVLLRPPSTADAPQLSLVCALAVAGTVEAAIARSTWVKWPNDVLVGDAKVAGILLESRGGGVVCGIGLNVGQAEAALPRGTRHPAASLRSLTGREHDRAALLVALLDDLERRYDAWLRDGLGPLVPELEARDALCGRPVEAGGVTGVAAGIAPDGRLRVVAEDGTEVLVASGEVDVTPPASP
jgi:BirA family transcriptional regulator, biotin operon repressor / biotin---[acetyl-CoA-carboxylase] ligase